MDIGYLSTYGLQRANAMDYFYTSPFFDTSSNNQRVRSQGVALDQHLSILQTMTGIEYVLHEHNTCEPNLFVYRKQRRRSPNAADLIDVYYCTDGIIYKAPDFLNLVKTRVTKATYYLDKGFEAVRLGAHWADETGEDDSYRGGEGKRRRKSGFVCWSGQSGAGARAGEKAEGREADDGAGAMNLDEGGEEEADLFFAKRRLRDTQRRSERVIRDFPTFKGVLQDISLK